jgi:MFS family permease
MSEAVVAAPPRLPPVVKSLGAVSLLNDLASEMVYPLLPAFVTGGLGGGAVTLGVLDGLSDAAAAGARLYSGWLADRPTWRRPLVVLGYAVAAIARPLTAVASAGWHVVAFRTADRVGKGMRSPPRDAVIADAAAPEIHGRAFGFHRAMDHAGATVGPLVATALLTLAGLSPAAVIAWAAVPGVAAVIVVWFTLKKETRPEPAPPPAAPRRPEPSPSIALDRPRSPLFALIVLFAFARLPETLLILRLQDLGVAVALVPVTWAALHVVRTAASYPGGWVSDRAGPARTMQLGWLLYAGVCVALAHSSTPAMGVVWFLVFGLVAGATESSERALVALLGGAERRGRLFGVYHAAVGLAALPGGLLLGALYAAFGGTVALLMSGGLAAAMVVAALVLSRARQERP